MKRERQKTCLLILLVAFCIAAMGLSARAQNSPTAALINEQLDKLVRLEINNTLPQAMVGIGRQTGVRLEADSAVWELLPWGDQTTITAKIENQTLRSALEAITRKLGLQFVLKDEAVQIEPMPALRRLGRRATLDELRALDLLASTPMAPPKDRPTVRQLVDMVDQKLLDLKSSFAMEFRAADAVKAETTVFVPRHATLMDALESLHRDTSVTWYPWGKSIVVVPKEDSFRQQLRRTISARYNGVDISQVLLELEQRTGVPFSMEPGAVQRIAPEFRTVRLTFENTPVNQALEHLAAFTGLGYVVNDKGVYIWNQSGGAGRVGRDPIVGMISVPEAGVQVLLPQSQVPPDVREYLQHKAQQHIQSLRQQMKKENFRPSTQPATAPGNRDL